MTRDELIERLKRSIAGKGKPKSDYGEGWIDGMNVALRHVEKLDSPPAMAWQDEPTCGKHELSWQFAYVEGDEEVDGEFYIARMLTWNRFLGDWTGAPGPLNGRRVCPIPAPPALNKERGNAR